MAGLTFITGGAKSGKSAYAEVSAEAIAGPRLYIATAEAHDDEMRQRIDQHRQRRAGRWDTVEAPLDVAPALLDARSAEGAQYPVVLLDCLTLWLTNVMLGNGDVGNESTVLLSALERAARTRDVFVVSNETGLGIVPDNALARQFRDHAGVLNQRVAAASTAAWLVVAGLPLRIK